MRDRKCTHSLAHLSLILKHEQTFQFGLKNQFYQKFEILYKIVHRIFALCLWLI